MEKGITLRGILHFYIPLNLHFYFTLYNTEYEMDKKEGKNTEYDAERHHKI
jgi:hypothetical protein